MAKAVSYKGFGEVHGLREWARLLDVNKDTLRYWLATKGLTVEEFAKQNGIAYQADLDDSRGRVNRVAQAEALLNDLFDRSGYDVDLLDLEFISSKRCMRVRFNGDLVGDYNIDKGSLIFAQGFDEGVNLLDYPVADPKIYFFTDREESKVEKGQTAGEYACTTLRASGWGLHPETKAKLAKRWHS